MECVGPQAVHNILGKIELCIHCEGGEFLIANIKDPQKEQSSLKQRVARPPCDQTALQAQPSTGEAWVVSTNVQCPLDYGRRS